MSDDYHSFLVTFERNIGEEVADELESAIRQLRHVIGVHRNAVDFNSVMAVDRARRQLGDALWHVLYPKDSK